MFDGRVSLQAAIAATRSIDSHTYEADLPLDHCNGTVVHGGYLASLLLHTIQQHFDSTLKKYNQPHIFNISFTFLRRVTPGNATVKIDDVKLGPRISITHAMLAQNGQQKVVAYAANLNMHATQGISHDVGFKLDPAPPDFHCNELEGGDGENWVPMTFPWHPRSLLKAATHVRSFFPVREPLRPDITDIWITPCSTEESFTTESLGFIADTWHRIPENHLPGSVWSHSDIISTARRAAQGLIKDTEIGSSPPTHFYPTLSMSLDIKELLPREGVKWLFIRAQVKRIENGRMDAEVLIFNQAMDLIALSHQLCLVIENPEMFKDREGGSSKL